MFGELEYKKSEDSEFGNFPFDNRFIWSESLRYIPPTIEESEANSELYLPFIHVDGNDLLLIGINPRFARNNTIKGIRYVPGNCDKRPFLVCKAAWAKIEEAYGLMCEDLSDLVA